MENKSAYRMLLNFSFVVTFIRSPLIARFGAFNNSLSMNDFKLDLRVAKLWDLSTEVGTNLGVFF
jgi:hypothetical protein